VHIQIPPTSIWARVRGAPHELSALICKLDAWSEELDPQAFGRAVYVQEQPEDLRVLTGALLALWRRGELPVAPPPPVWSTGPLQEVDDICLRMHKDGLLWEHQAQAAAAALRAPAGRGLIDISTGGGKTRTCAAIIAVGALDSGAAPWLYLVMNKELAAQAEESIRGLLPAFAAAAGSTAPRLRACSYGGISKLREPVFAGVLVDEAHSLPPPTRSMEYARVRASWRIGLSGTILDRLDANNALTVGFLGPVLFQVQVGALQRRGHLAQGAVEQILYDADRDEVFE